MNSRMVEYYKTVLDKISLADRVVFRKELRKAFKKLLPEERGELKQWFRNNCLCRVRGEQDLALEPVRPAGDPSRS